MRGWGRWVGMRGWGRWVGKEVGMVGGDEGMGKVGG
jgi:hypothetical protein